MNSAFQRIKSDPNLLIPYALAILSGGVLVMLILWRALSADAGVPPPVVAKDAPTSIVVPTRTAVVIPTPTPEQQLPQPLVTGNPILPAPDIGTAVPNDQTGSGLDTGPTPDINSEDYENRVALPAPNEPDTNVQPGSPLATPGQPGFPATNPTQEPLGQGSGGLAPLPTPDVGTQEDLTPLPTPVDTVPAGPEPSATPVAVQTPDINVPNPTPGLPVDPTATPTPAPQATGPEIPKLPEGILLPDVSDTVFNALNSGSPLPVDLNTAAGVTAGATQVTAQAYLVEDLGFSIGGYKGVLSDANWLLLADTGALGPLVYYWNNYTLVVAGLESSQMAELGEQRGPGVVVALYDPS